MGEKIEFPSDLNRVIANKVIELKKIFKFDAKGLDLGNGATIMEVVGPDAKDFIEVLKEEVEEIINFEFK